MKETSLQRPGRAPAPTVPDFALWQLGFRPLYLVAAIFAVLDIGVWALQFGGSLQQSILAGPMWHAHEMIFGYALAVIAGFLLTAVRNWTGLPTPTGTPLMAMVAIWVLARVLAFAPWPLATALANAGFAVAVAVGIGLPIMRARNRRNYFFMGLLGLFALLALLAQATLQGLTRIEPLAALRLALDLVLFIMVVMAGRVVPMFTNNGIPGLAARRHPLIEKLSLGAVIALFLADLLVLANVPAAGFLAGLFALIAALANGVRLALWQPLRTFSRATALVWVLHVAYGWIVVHLLLRAGAAVDLGTHSLAVHALTTGAIGMLTLGMMTRTARGHTGRPLRADGFETVMFVLVGLSAVLRVFGPLFEPARLVGFIEWSALFWVAAFGLYIVRYWPVLSRPRLDGKPG